MIIGLEISSDFAHFSHPATIYSSLTYPVPPKTTVMGMLGAIMGLEDYLFLNSIKYACVVKKIEAKRSFCFNGVKNALSELNLDKAGIGFKSGRKQFYRELLVNPCYEIYIDLSDIEKVHRDRIVELLKAKKSLYPLYMGVNFALADYRFLGVFDSTQERGDADLDSIVPLDSNFAIEAGRSYTDIRFATKIESGRHFGNFADFLVETSGKSIKCRDVCYTRVDDKSLIFV